MHSATDDMDELEIGMSNFDHSIDEALDPALRLDPAKVFCFYTAWNFNARVWFDGAQFVAEVWVHRINRGEIKANTLPDLMTAVSDQYGWQ